jgi:hypothetical protein
LSSSRWRPNALAGGDFEQLNHMLQNGWRQRRTEDPSVETAVELSFDSPRAGRSSLRIQASQRQAAVARFDDSPISITSGPVTLAAGQIVRVHGWVRIPHEIGGSFDGLMITDSLGGPALAERIRQTRGWQEFTLYRVAPGSGPVTVTFALTGFGEAWLDDITISPLE